MKLKRISIFLLLLLSFLPLRVFAQSGDTGGNFEPIAIETARLDGSINGADLNAALAVSASMRAANLALVQSVPTKLYNNQKTVTLAGTAVQFSATTVPITGIVVRALSTNGGAVYVGSSTVTSTNGYELQPDESVSIPIDNLTKVWVNAAVNGDKICYVAVAM